MHETVIETANSLWAGVGLFFALVLGMRIAGTILLKMLVDSFKFKDV